MPTATMTSKGQITIPAEIRRKMGLKAGDRIDFYENEYGEYTIRPKTGSIMDMRGCVPSIGRTVSLEEMDEAIGQYVVEMDEATKSDAGGSMSRGEAA